MVREDCFDSCDSWGSGSDLIWSIFWYGYSYTLRHLPISKFSTSLVTSVGFHPTKKSCLVCSHYRVTSDNNLFSRISALSPSTRRLRVSRFLVISVFLWCRQDIRMTAAFTRQKRRKRQLVWRNGGALKTRCVIVYWISDVMNTRWRH